MVEAIIIGAFEDEWDKILKKVLVQKELVDKWKRNGNGNGNGKKIEQIDFSTLNLLTFHILRIEDYKTDEEILEILKNIPNRSISVEEHKKYFEYARALAQFIEQSSNARIGKLVAEIKE